MAQRQDIEIEQGETFVGTFVVLIDGVAFDLTGYHARLQARANPTDTDFLLNLDSADDNSPLTVNESSGFIGIELDSVTTATLDFTVAPYTLEIYDDDTPPYVQEILEGYITLAKDV